MLCASGGVLADYVLNFKAGPAYEYVRYTQGCLPHQSGTMIGPVIQFDLYHSCGLATHLTFKGLFDIPHISSINGLFIDATEYEAVWHCGYEFNSLCRIFLLEPFVGIDFFYLRHENAQDVLSKRYFNINVPVGLRLTYLASDCYTLGLNAYYDIDAWTRLKVQTPGLCDIKDVKVCLKRSHKFQIAALFQHNFDIGNYTCELAYEPLFCWQQFARPKCCFDVPINRLKHWHVGHMLTIGIQF
jgi:hypothetical protein